jgi:hypothetical protein
MVSSDSEVILLLSLLYGGMASVMSVELGITELETYLVYRSIYLLLSSGENVMEFGVE